MTRFSFARFFDVDDNGGVLPPSAGMPPPEVTPAVDPKPGRVTCEGCGCALDTQGRIIRRGDGLRVFMAREDEIASLKKSLDSASETNTELSRRVSELEAGAKKRGYFF